MCNCHTHQSHRRGEGEGETMSNIPTMGELDESIRIATLDYMMWRDDNQNKELCDKQTASRKDWQDKTKRLYDRLASYETAGKSATVDGVVALAKTLGKEHNYDGGHYGDEFETELREAVTVLVAQSTYNSVATMEAVVARDEAMRDRDALTEQLKRAEAVVEAARTWSKVRAEEPRLHFEPAYSEWQARESDASVALENILIDEGENQMNTVIDNGDGTITVDLAELKEQVKALTGSYRHDIDDGKRLTAGYEAWDAYLSGEAKKEVKGDK